MPNTMAKQARRVPRVAAVCGLLLLALGVLALCTGRHVAGTWGQVGVVGVSVAGCWDTKAVRWSAHVKSC